jgi:hypothetical protein
MAVSKWTHLRGLIAVAALAGVATAQAPVVPTDHYGPPQCSTKEVVTPPVIPGICKSLPANSTAAEIASCEQELGAKNGQALLATEPMENFDIARDRLVEYVECTRGCYWADLDAQFARAEGALATAVTLSKPGQKLAMVLDIDETAMSSYCEMKRLDFGYISPLFNEWVVSREAAVAIPGGLRLFEEAKKAGVAVFFITGRPGTGDYGMTTHSADQTVATQRNLESAGYRGWAGLALRNGSENGMTTIDYKASERRKILDKGYHIVLSVGDQWSDLLGDPQADVSVKLPNPFYFLP